MKNKVIALIMIIPILLLITLFSVGKLASLYVDIPVTGINITTQNQDGFINLDMAEYKNDIYLTAQVEPANAHNQKYRFEVSGVDDQAPADVVIEDDGRLVVNGDGKAKVTAVSLEKGFTDSIIVSIHSTKVLSITPTLKDNVDNIIQLSENQGEYYADINSGLYDFGNIIYPTQLADASVSWQSSNPDVLEINAVTGKAKAKLSGEATISVVCPSAVGGVLKVDTHVNVRANHSASGINIDGMSSNSLVFARDVNSVEFLVEKTAGNNGEIELTYDPTQVLSHEIIAIGNSDNQYRVKLNLRNNHADKVSLQVNIQGVSQKSDLVLNFADMVCNIYTSYHKRANGDINQRNKTQVVYWADCEPYDADVTYQWSVDDDNVTAESNGNNCTLSANKEGTVTLTLEAYKSGNKIGECIKVVNIVKPIYAIDFVDNATTWGIENIKTVGNSIIKNDTYTSYNETLTIRLNFGGSDVEYYSGEGLVFSSDNIDAIKPHATLNAFKVNVVNDGIATITANWQYAEYFGVDIKGKIKLRGVNGVKVSDYAQLRKATEDGKQIVLASDISLGEPDASVEQLKSQLKSINTSYDYQFYLNKGLARPTVDYIIEFKNNVWGNGYTIDADRFTQAVDSTGTPLIFKGPLDFVNIATAAVKAQDNIVFLVRNKGVVINNVQLKGCKDQSLIDENNGFDLNKLNYTGTTLEIMNDCQLINSRVSNGRTTVRIYGGDFNAVNPVVTDQSEVDVANERIKCYIGGCVLSNAREFIVKIGSNRAVLSTLDDNGEFMLSKLKRADGTDYSPIHGMAAKEETFYNDCVLTDVTIENSILSTSGLFCIGVEAHFGGIMLSGMAEIKLNGWNKLAATSFACKLSLKGQVTMLDWKKLEELDSSTLIETNGEVKEFLKLDIAAMLSKVCSKDEYKNVIDTIDGQDYVHGGLVLYGGGYNYSYCDFSEFESENLTRYDVNLSVLAEGETDTNSSLYMQGTLLPLAAGPSDFVFYMYDAESLFNYHRQQEYENGANISPVELKEVA
ncbi:MAG: hypothetical protein SOY25_00695 [Eubacteriales bacterium]|nr:hypothetical protein [Eubacteriales bacterium]